MSDYCDDDYCTLHFYLVLLLVYCNKQSLHLALGHSAGLLLNRGVGNLRRGVSVPTSKALHVGPAYYVEGGYTVF